jgi:hypothetical protein
MTDLPDVLNSIVKWLNIIIGIFLLTFGIIGNCLNIYVFTRPAYRNRTTVLYFLACSVASSIQLLNTLLPRILSDGFQISAVNSNNFYCQIRNLISAVASLCAISYPCWASFDQFVSTSRNPTTRQHWSSKRFISWVIFSTALFWFIIFLPNTIFTRSFKTCITNNPIVIYIYSYAVTPISFTILPIILFTYFNIGIVKNLRDAPVIAISNTNKRMARQVLRMLVPQLIILIASGLPFTIETLYSAATMLIKKGSNQQAIENLIVTITRLLFYLNYISSFYIYTLMSNEFRRLVFDLFYKETEIFPHGTPAVIPMV